MTDPALRERAALDVLARLPEWWQVGPASYDPGIAHWAITARGPHPGRGKVPETLTGRGEDELAAFADLRMQLDERQRPEKLEAIERRGRAAFLEGAEAQSQAADVTIDFKSSSWWRCSGSCRSQRSSGSSGAGGALATGEFGRRPQARIGTSERARRWNVTP